MTLLESRHLHSDAVSYYIQKNGEGELHGFSRNASDLDKFIMQVWSKKEVATLAEFPPAELRPSKEHTGWRDPFLFERPTPENDM